MATHELQTYAAPVAGRAALWRFFLGTILVVIVWIAVTAGVVWAAWTTAPGSAPFAVWIRGMAPPETPRMALTALATFAGMWAGVWVAAGLLQRRGLRSVLGPRRRVVRDFAVAAGIYGGVVAATIAVWAVFWDAVPNLDPATWAALLPLAILLVLLQTGAEELVFRGWFLQSLAARFRSPIVWGALPALLFGVLHMDPATFGGSVWAVVGAAAIFGLFAADLTARTGSLGAAWGFHFANNIAALVFVANAGGITGLALFQTPYRLSEVDGAGWAILADVAIVALGWVLIRRRLSP